MKEKKERMKERKKQTNEQKRKKERKNKERITKSQFSCSIFLSSRRIDRTLGVSFTKENPRVFMYKSFASLCCVHLGGPAIPYVQDTI